MLKPPRKLFFKSDNTEAELVLIPARLIKMKKPPENMFYYRYTKAMENMGKEFPLTLDQIKYLQSLNLLTIIL